MSTLERLRRLEDYGSDALIDATIGKLLKLKRQEAIREFKRVRGKIQKLEQSYQMGSDDFLARYRSGELGDNVDYLRWASLLDMRALSKILTSVKNSNCSFHLQASEGTLIARWDNAPHYPGLDNFPHHCHRGDPEGVVSSRAMTAKMFLRELRRWYRRRLPPH